MARTKQSNVSLATKIGQIIRVQRKAAGWTQAALAEAIGLETETISRMENGLRLPTVEKLVDIADVFGIPVAAFFETADTAARQPEAQLYAEKMRIAVEQLPDTGKTFVLEVAQNYARYHHADPVKPRSRKKAEKTSDKE